MSNLPAIKSMKKTSLVIPALIISLLQPISSSAATDNNDTIHCSENQKSTLDLILDKNSPQTCSFSKNIISQCLSIDQSSIYSQCNIFRLSLNKTGSRFDDSGREYDSVTFKYSESNDCSGGNDLTFLSKCDIYASYVQLLRNKSSGKCYALVNSALLGTQLMNQTERNNPAKIVRKVEIPGVSRRILFTPSNATDLIKESNSFLLKTANPSRKSIRSGDAVSSLFILELENALTTKPDNLKPNPAKMRLTRGEGTSSDFIDFSLGKKQENELNLVLANCQ